MKKFVFQEFCDNMRNFFERAAEEEMLMDDFIKETKSTLEECGITSHHISVAVLFDTYMVLEFLNINEDVKKASIHLTAGGNFSFTDYEKPGEGKFSSYYAVSNAAWWRRAMGALANEYPVSTRRYVEGLTASQEAYLLKALRAGRRSENLALKALAPYQLFGDAFIDSVREELSNFWAAERFDNKVEKSTEHALSHLMMDGMTSEETTVLCTALYNKLGKKEYLNFMHKVLMQIKHIW